VLARQMGGAYAGFLEHVDHHVGRPSDALEQPGVLDDNNDRLLHHRRQRRLGRGDDERRVQRWLHLPTGMAALETPEFLVNMMDEPRHPTSCTNARHSVGWAWAMDTLAPVDEAGRPRTGVPATALSRTGRRGIEYSAGCARSSPVIGPWRRRRLRGRRGRLKGMMIASTVYSSRRWRAPACCGLQRARTPRSVTTRSTEMFGNRGNLPLRLVRGHLGIAPRGSHGRRRGAGVR